MTQTEPVNMPVVETFTDAKGHQFNFVHMSRPNTGKLVIHFSAFFGDWGDRAEYRELYQGYFHRWRMFKDVPDYGFLFLCDQFGADHNGTYYTGEKGDFFVERAIVEIIKSAVVRDGINPANIVTIGSSMGATAALKFGIQFGARGVIAISPHIDLDISAKLQGRMRHVAFIVPDGEPLAPANWRYTRQVRNIVVAHDTVHSQLPRLLIHGCADDHGVYEEQVRPFADLWRSKGGALDLDVRPRGGHTSDYATRELLLDAIEKFFTEDCIDAQAYASNPRFLPQAKPLPVPNRFTPGPNIEQIAGIAGLWSDGWSALHAELVLTGTTENQLVIQGTVPVLGRPFATTLAVSIDGNCLHTLRVEPGRVDFRLSMPARTGPRRISLEFAMGQDLPPPDTRRVGLFVELIAIVSGNAAHSNL